MLAAVDNPSPSEYEQEVNLDGELRCTANVGQTTFDLTLALDVDRDPWPETRPPDVDLDHIPDWILQFNNEEAAPSANNFEKQRTRTIGTEEFSIYDLCDADIAVGEFDFFLSHKQSNAQDAVKLLRLGLAERLPSATFWLDTEQDPTEQGMHHGVKHCRDFILFCTEGVTESKWVKKELSWATAMKKNIILVGETDERHGKPDIEALTLALPHDLQSIFTENVVIPWYRQPEFQSVSLDKIIQARATQNEFKHEYHKSRPLIYKSKSGDGEHVIDPSFVIFTALCGVCLPGATNNTMRWSFLVRAILITCGFMCFSRLFTPEGPAFMDYITIVQIFVAHPVIFLLLHFMVTVLTSPLVAELVGNIDCRHEACGLRFRTKVLTCVAALLTVLLSIWGWAAYLPGFFHPEYVGPTHGWWNLFGLGHGLIWVCILPLFFGSFLSSLLIFYILQELAFMGVLTSFNELHSHVAKLGLCEVTRQDLGINVRDTDLYRFEAAFRKNWVIYKRVHQKLSPPFLIFWVIELMILAWSIPSIARGIEPAYDDPRVDRLEKHIHLEIRLTWWVGSGLFAGVGCYLVALLPWYSNYSASLLQNMCKLLLLTQPNLQNNFTMFTDRFDMRFTVCFLRTRLTFLPFYLALLLTNTAGAVVDAVRVWRVLYG